MIGAGATAAQSRRLAEIRARLPFRITMPGVPPTVRDLDSLIEWLDRYATHAAAEVDKLNTERAKGARAQSILRELDTVLANAVDEVAEAKARQAVRDSVESHVGPYGVGPLPGE